MSPSLEFDCGITVASVGSVALACKAHINKCSNVACQAEVLAEARKCKLV